MITAIFIDNKGFRRVEMLPPPAPPFYRFPIYQKPRSYNPDSLAEGGFKTSVVYFYRYDKIAEDVFEYREE